jgi:hypothetical protein
MAVIRLLVTFMLGVLFGLYLSNNKQDVISKSESLDIEAHIKQVQYNGDNMIGGSEQSYLLGYKHIADNENKRIEVTNTSNELDMETKAPAQSIRIKNHNDEGAHNYASPDYWRSVLYVSDSYDEKLTAIEELVYLRDSDALAVGLGDSNVNLRVEVIKGLTQIADEKSAQIIGQVLFSESDMMVRDEAINSLQLLDHFSASLVFIQFAQPITP